MYFAEAVMEVDTELLHLKFSCPFVSASFCYLQEIANVVVEFLYFFFGWEGTLQLSLQSSDFLAVAENNGMRRLSVTSGATSLLVVALQ
jgi:hypothetical protein